MKSTRNSDMQHFVASVAQSIYWATLDEDLAHHVIAQANFMDGKNRSSWLGDALQGEAHGAAVEDWFRHPACAGSRFPTETLWLAVNKAEMESSQVGAICARWFPEG